MIDFEFKTSSHEKFRVVETDSSYVFTSYWKPTDAEVWYTDDEVSVPKNVMQALNREIFKEEMEKHNKELREKMNDQDFYDS